jgi:hypothetical protein
LTWNEISIFDSRFDCLDEEERTVFEESTPVTLIVLVKVFRQQVERKALHQREREEGK